MSGEDEQDRPVGERIANVIRANEQIAKKQLPDNELQKLKAAAARLEHLLSEAQNAETEELKTAANRLDQILKDLGAGKDLSQRLKLRRLDGDGSK